MNPKLIGVFLLLISAVFLPAAFGDLQKSMTVKAPVTVSFTEFDANLPSEGWFNITGAQLEIAEALFVAENGKIGNIYIPARKKGEEIGTEQPISVLVKTNDAKILDLIKKMRVVENQSAKEQDLFLSSHLDQLQVARNLQGTIAEGVDALDAEDKAAIERSDIQMASRFVILQEGATPSIGGRIFMLLFGLAIFGGGLVMLFKKKPAAT